MARAKRKTAKKRQQYTTQDEVPFTRPGADDEMDAAFDDLATKRKKYQTALKAQTKADKTLVNLAKSKGLLEDGGLCVYFGPSGRGVNIGVQPMKDDAKPKEKCAFFTPKKRKGDDDE